MTIGIFSWTWLSHNWDENNYFIGGIGGSEVWAIKTSEELSKKGYCVYLFGNPKEQHISEAGVNYITNDLYESMSEQINFDYFICSRFVPNNIDKIKSDNIFLMMHDMSIDNMPSSYNDKIGKIKKIFCLSDFQKENLKSKFQYLPDSAFCYTRNGVDSFIYEKYKNLERKNKMVCSSGHHRQALWLTTYVFPLIKKEIPDFELILCHYYDTFDDPIYYQDGIKIIGDCNNQISKENLIKAQCECKIWIYANYGRWNLYEDSMFNETFCITALEACCAKSAIIVGERSPFPETLKGYNHFLGKELFSENILDSLPIENTQKFAEILANEAIKCLKDEDYRQSLVKKTYPIGINSSWENATEYIINEFKKYQ